ncbi:MAG: peptidylprolyl isomerase [Chloroflexota bacterium]
MAEKISKLSPRSRVILGSVAAVAVVIAIVVVALLSGVGVAAIVNGQRIWRGEFYRVALDRSGEEVLDELISNRLIEQEGAKNHVVIDQAKIDERLAEYKRSIAGGDDATWQAVLAQYGMTERSLRETIRRDMIAEEIIGKDITVTDEDITTYFEQNRDNYAEDEQVRASHILVGTKEEADAIRAQLAGGADFAALAKEKSLDTASGAQGGDLGYFGRDQMDPAFEEAAFELAVGELSQPVKSQFGYHIIKVTDHKQAREYALEEVKDRVRQDVLTSKISERYPDWVAGLKAKAKIVQYWKKS